MQYSLAVRRSRLGRSSGELSQRQRAGRAESHRTDGSVCGAARKEIRMRSGFVMVRSKKRVCWAIKFVRKP